MMRPDAKVEKVYLYPKPVDFRKSIDGLAALVELDIKVAVFDPVVFVFLNEPRNRVKILYWERNGFCFSHQERSGLLQYFLLKLQPVDTGLKLVNGLLLRREPLGSGRNAPALQLQLANPAVQ